MYQLLCSVGHSWGQQGKDRFSTLGFTVIKIEKGSLFELGEVWFNTLEQQSPTFVAWQPGVGRGTGLCNSRLAQLNLCRWWADAHKHACIAWLVQVELHVCVLVCRPAACVGRLQIGHGPVVMHKIYNFLRVAKVALQGILDLSHSGIWNFHHKSCWS